MAVTHTIPDLDAKGLRSFGLSTGTIITVLFGLVLPWLFGLNWPLWPWIVGALLALWALLAPITLAPVYKGWMKAGLLLSKITTPIIMSVVFLLLIVPVGLIMRLTRPDPLRRALDNQADSYRQPSEPHRDDHFDRPF